MKEVISCPLPPAPKIRIIMKAMSKSELADRAGVSVQTLMNWCRPFRQELEAMGMVPNAKLLPPHIVQFISDKFAIDV